MNIALIASSEVSLQEIAKFLKLEGIVAEVHSLEELKSSGANARLQKAVVIVPHHGAGVETERARAIFDGDHRLLLCTSQPSNTDRQLLKDLGASEILTPRSWSPHHIAERILAQLIVEGDITPSFQGQLYGATEKMRALYRDIEAIAPLADSVLILGETGTGKELVAREIHRLSGRNEKFVAINCGELSVDLSSSDLFGHKKGSFTGATEARHGLFAEAGDGTIFLDEIGEFDLLAQAKLLRVLEDRAVRRVGSNQWERIGARFILATNRDLVEECDRGKFRQDLFHRINELTLELIPLRERMADIPLLVERFVEEFNTEYDKHLKMPDNTIDALFNYSWPGNVRELRAAIRKGAAYADPFGQISAIRLREAASHGRKRISSKGSVEFDPNVDTWREALGRLQLAYFNAVLAVSGGSKEEARKRAGLSRSQFYEKIKENSSQ